MKQKILCTAAILFFFLIYNVVSILFQTRGDGNPAQTILIERGSSAGAVADRLFENGMIKSKEYFKLSLFLLGAQNRIMAGRYLISPAMTNYRIIKKLSRGEVVPPQPIKATFPEGTSIYKMGKILESKNFPAFAAFQDLVRAGNVADYKNQFGFLFDLPGFSLEGYLFPDTYIFADAVSEEDLAKLMLKRFEAVVMPYWRENSKNTKYNLHQIITLASIIEKEAQKPAERPVISSVFHNRLNIGMPLDACPTIKYALNDPTKKVYADQLEVQSPYNTYRNKGLPPGPICNPGIDSIKAAIYPAKTKYFYFVARPDGSHAFSASFAEHQKARRKFG